MGNYLRKQEDDTPNPMRFSLVLRALLVATLMAIAACGKPAAPPGWIAEPECVVFPSSPPAADITVALAEPVRPTLAPLSHTTSEQLIFHHLYETLLTVNCLGQVRPGLAANWRRRDDGRRWSFELRENARFWDGTPVTASDVLAGWNDTWARSPIFSATIDSVTVDGGRSLSVYLRKAQRDVPRVLATAEFAVAKRSQESEWAIGTGRYRVSESDPRGSNSPRKTLVLKPTDGARGALHFTIRSGADPADVLDHTVDVMISRDSRVVEYARAVPDLELVPLVWDRTYVLLSPSRVAAVSAGERVEMVPWELADALARDAVRGDARGHRSPAWWDEVGDCDDDAGRSPLLPSSERIADAGRRILYDAGDPVARDLAERIVAIALADPSRSPESAALVAAVPALLESAHHLVAEGVGGTTLSSHVRYGDGLAFVIAVPCRPADPCYEAQALLARAPWLSPRESDLSEAIVPLVDTSAYVIARKDRVTFVTDWHGNVFITNGMGR